MSAKCSDLRQKYFWSYYAHHHLWYLIKAEITDKKSWKHMKLYLKIKSVWMDLIDCGFGGM